MERALIAWFDAAGGDTSPRHLLRSGVINKILKITHCSDVQSFLKSTFPCCVITDEEPAELIASLFLLYVVFSPNPLVQPLIDVLCRLDNNIQLTIKEFVSPFDGVAFKDVTVEAVKNATPLGVASPCSVEASPCPGTPSQIGELSAVESPLQQFFQTPQRKKRAKKERGKCCLCNGGELLRQLNLRLEEEDTCKASLDQALAESQNNNTELQRKVQLAETRCLNIEANLASLESELDEKTQQLACFQQADEENARQMAVLREDLVYAEAGLADSSQRRTKLEEALLEATSQVTTLTSFTVSQLQLFDEMIGELEGKCGHMESGLREALERNSELEELLELQNAALRESRENFHALKTGQEELDDSSFLPSSQEADNLAHQLMIVAQEENAQFKHLLEQATNEKSLLGQKFASEMDASKKAMDAMRTELESRLDEAAKQIQGSSKECEILVEKVKELNGLNESLKADKINLELVLLEAEEKGIRLEAETASLIAQKTAVSNELEEMKRAFDVSESERLSLQSAVAEGTHQMETSIRELTAIAEKLDATENARNEQMLLIDQLNVDLKKKSNAALELETSLLEAKSLLQNTKADKESLEETVGDLIKNEHELREELANYLQRISSQSDALSNLTASLEGSKQLFESEMAKSCEEKKKLNNEVQDLLKKEQELREELANSLQQISAQSDALSNLEVSFEESKQQFDCEMAKSCDEKEKLTAQVQDLLKKKHELSEELENCKQQVSSRSDVISNLEASFEKLKQMFECEMAKSCEENKKMNAEVEDLMKKEQELREALASSLQQISTQSDVVSSLELSLEQSKQLFEREMFKSCEEKEKLITEVQDLLKREQELREELANSLQQISAYSDAISCLEASLVESKQLFESEMAKTCEEKENLQTGLAVKTEAVSRLEITLKETKEELRKDLAEKIKALAVKEQTESQLNETICHQEKTLCGMIEGHNQICAELNGAKAELETSLIKNQSLEKEMERVMLSRETIISNLKEEKTLILSQLSDAETLTQTLKITGEESKALINQLTQELKAAGKKQEEVSARLQEQSIDLALKEKLIESLQKDLCDVKSGFEGERDAMETTIAEIKSHNEKLSQELEERRVELASQLEVVSQTQSSINSLKDACAEHMKNLEEQLNLVIEKGLAIEDLEKQLAETVAEKNTALESFKLAQAELSERKESEAQLQEKVEAVTEDVNRLSTVIEDLEKQLTETAAEKNTILESFKLAQDQLAEGKESKGRLQEEVETVIADMSRLTAEWGNNQSELEKEIVELRQEKDKLASELEDRANVVLQNAEVIVRYENFIEELRSKLEQQAVDYSREKMQMSAQLEMHQRESAVTLRHLEAKNLALDEVKNVAMSKVHELLNSHNQLQSELGELVNKSAENTKLDLQVKEAQSKCRDLSSDLAHALKNVEAFKATVQHLKSEQEQMKLVAKEKDELIQDLKKASESAKKTVTEQSKGMKRLLAAFSFEGTEQGNNPEMDCTETFGIILNRFRNVLESRTARQNETLTLANTLRNEVHVLQCDKLRMRQAMEEAKPQIDFWTSAPVKHLLVQLAAMKDGQDIGEACKAVLEAIPIVTGLDSLGEVDEKEDLVKIGKSMTEAKAGFLHLLKMAEKLRQVAEERRKLQSKVEEDYKALEERTLSLAEMNSRLSTEILKSKNLSSMELSMRENELASLKTTVSALNQKIEQLSNGNEELGYKNRELTDNLESLRAVKRKVLALCENKKKSEHLLVEILTAKERVDATLGFLRTAVPEMLTVISTLEQRRDGASRSIQTAFKQSMAQSEKIMQVLEMKDVSTDEADNNLPSILDTLIKILENGELIKSKRPSEDLSDSLEEVPVQDKTFPIVNLHNDTFCMPPSVSEPPPVVAMEGPKVAATDTKKSRSAWVVSPPSKKKKIPVVRVKSERSVTGETWVIPCGPAPAKPARKAESRSRTDSESSNSSTRSLPPDLSSRHSSRSIAPSSRPPVVSYANSVDVSAKQVQKEKELNEECQTLRAKVAELEEKRAKERDQYEAARAATRSKYEKELEHKKTEMKQLYSQEMAKQNAAHKEQAKMVEELKRSNEELRKQNAAHKEHVDDLRSQLWSLGDQLLQTHNRPKDQDGRLDLSRQLDKITLQPSDSWSCASGPRGESGTTDVSGSRQPSHFPSMPVEDEDEIFDNRCLEELKAGPSSLAPRNRQSRLTELQLRNSLCLPHLKSSYPAETQFDSPQRFREADLRTSTIPFVGSESQSLTDSSDPSMTRSLLPAEKTKKKEQTSYKRPGPPTPSKNGRPSLQGDVRLTPKRPLREQNVTQDKARGTPSRLKALFTKSNKRESLGHDENSAPSTPRGKGLRIFQRKPFGGRDF